MYAGKIEFLKRRDTADAYEVDVTQCGMCSFALNIRT
jgi:hypothetical protein